MKTLIAFMCMFIASVSFAQAPTVILVPFDKGKLAWTWDKGTGGDVAQFNVKCGTSSGTYTMTSTLNCPTCRSALVSSVVSAMGSYFCVVTAQNSFGESGPSNEVAFTTGLIPAPTKNVIIQVQ